MWETRSDPSASLICYDFWFNPELSRHPRPEGRPVDLNCSATFAGPGKRDYLVHTTAVRAQENLIYTASANRSARPRQWPRPAASTMPRRSAAYLGHSTIAGPAFPRFNHVLRGGG